MNGYRNFDQFRTTEFTVVRSGFWMPDYVLTDGQFEYGKLTRTSSSVSERTIETAKTVFTLRKPGIFSRKTIIWKNGEQIGQITRNTWSYTNTLELNDGFKASFTRTPNAGLFTSKMSWVNNGEELIKISGVFSFSRPMIVSVMDNQLVKQEEHLLLMAFIGINLRLIRQARAAAA